MRTPRSAVRCEVFHSLKGFGGQLELLASEITPECSPKISAPPLRCNLGKHLGVPGQDVKIKYTERKRETNIWSYVCFADA